MAEFADLARRAVDGVGRLAARATKFAGFVCVAVLLIVTMSFALGLAALDGGIRTVWIVLGLVFGGMAVGRSFLATWRLAAVARYADQIVSEVRSLLERGNPATRTIVDTVEADARQGGGSVLVVSSDLSSLRDAIDDRAFDYPKLILAITALIAFPRLILGAIAITVVFAMFVPIFLLALAL